MSVNLAGANVTETFSTVGVSADPNAPYVNTGGANKAASLTLVTTAAGVTVTEAAGAFSGADDAIALTLSGPGEFQFLGANTYTGGTSLSGGKLSIANVTSLGAGTLTFAGNGATLEATVTGTMTNFMVIDRGVSATIEAAAGRAFIIGAAPKVKTKNLVTTFQALGGAGTTLHFGSATDFGFVDLAPTELVAADPLGAVSVDGGGLVIGSVAGANLISDLHGGLTVASGANAAIFEINSGNVVAYNLAGSSAGLITDNGLSATLTEESIASSTFAGVIENGTGELSLAVAGSGGTTLTLTGANTYTGGTSVAAGATLQIGNGGATGAIVGNIVDDGTLTFDRSDDVTFDGDLLGTGVVVKSGAGKLTLANASNNSGGTTIEGGTVSIGNIEALGTGTLTFGGDDTVLESTVTGNLSNAVLYSSIFSTTFEATAGNTLTFSTDVDGPGFDAGRGKTVHFGSSTDTGTVVWGYEPIQFIASNSAMSIDGGTFSEGGLSGAGANFVDALTGGVTVGSGFTTATLDIAGNSGLVTNLTGTSAGVITSSGTGGTVFAHNTVNTTYAGVIQDGTGAIALELSGSGGTTLTLTGTNTFTGGITIDSGQTLAIDNAAALGSGDLGFGGDSTLESTATETVANGISVFIDASARFAAKSGTTLTITAAEGGDTPLFLSLGSSLHFGSSVDTGTVDLAPPPNIVPFAPETLPLFVDGGTLVVGSAVAARLIASSDLTVGSGATDAIFDLDGESFTAGNLTGTTAGGVIDNAASAFLGSDNTENSTFAGVIQDGVGVVTFDKSGLATLTLTGANTYSGGTTIAAGDLELGSNASAGKSAITFGANAYGTLVLDPGVDPANAISLPDATDAIVFKGLAYAFDDQFVPLASGVVTPYALETAGGAFIRSLNLEGAFDSSGLIVGEDGAGGVEIAAPYTAAAAANEQATIAASSARILISDTAVNLAANQAAITKLIADGRVASVFTNSGGR